MEKAEQWYRTSAPQITPRIRTMWRYQYITRAMVEVALGEEKYRAAHIGLTHPVL